MLKLLYCSPLIFQNLHKLSLVRNVLLSLPSSDRTPTLLISNSKCWLVKRIFEKIKITHVKKKDYINLNWSKKRLFSFVSDSLVTVYPSWEKMQLLQNYCENFCKILQENASTLTNSCKICLALAKILRELCIFCKIFARVVSSLDESLSQCFCYRTNRIRYYRF